MMSPRARKILITLLLIGGVQVWLLLHGTVEPYQLYVLAAAVLAAIPPELVLRTIRRVRRASSRVRALTTAAVFVVSFGYLVFTALHQKRDLFPKYHDNQSYAIQAQIIASGRLWLPAHAHPEFFDTFHVITEPVYASMYFPGAAMLFAVGVLLHLPFWITGVTIAAGCVAMVYRVIAEVVDNFAGLLAALWLVSLMWFRHLSAMLMSHTVLLLLGLLMFWAFLRWRKEHRLRWALAVGAFAGWAAITRPADALCYALPAGIVMLWDLRRCAWGDWFRLAGTIVAGAAPFLVLQVIFNLGVTGKPFESPYRFYLDRDAPQLSFGFHEYNPAELPKSHVIQKNLYHVTFNGRLIRDHRPEKLLETWFDPSTGRLRLILESTSPLLFLAPLIFAGFLGLTTHPRLALVMILPLYCVLYLFYAALLRHYTPVIAPATILLGLLGMRQIEITWPSLRAVGATFGMALIVGTCVAALPEVNPRLEDDPFPYPEMVDARAELIPQNVRRPALVFVTFSLDVKDIGGDQVEVKENVHSEPVYNYDAARIDDNPIVFAHDLGERNIELLRYYNERQPQRSVYRYNRLARRLVPHGSVASELQRLEKLRAQHPPASQPARAP
jgi:hypothetical protein